MKDYAGIATQYAHDIVEGRILACRWVRLACARHLRDIDKDWRYDWNPVLARGEGDDLKQYRPADRACYFIELLPHIKGEWAAKSERIALQPWQVFIVCSIFGWVDRETGRRRFRIADLYVPRKNAKSTLAAGIGLYLLCADWEFGAEVYSGATSESQAREVFEPARLMVERTPELRARFGVTPRASNISVSETNSKFEPVIGKPGDGASPSCAIIDEYHEHASEVLYDTMRTGMGARAQPLILVITTAGDDISGPCYAHQQSMQQILEGVIEDDTRFGLIYTIDTDADGKYEAWDTEEALIKANPNFGISIDEEFLLTQLRDAGRDKRKQATYQTKHLNMWVASASPWLNLHQWQMAADKSLRIEDFAGAACWDGVDLANTTDIASRCKCFKRKLADGEHYYFFWRHYLPSAIIDDPDNKHYQGWHRDGWIIKTDGSMIDQDLIERHILEDSEKYAQEEIAFDPWGAPGIIGALQGHGLEVLTVQLQARFLSAPMKWVDGLLKSGRIHHNGDPVATWGVSNVEVKPDHNDNWFPRKQNRSKKTDPAIAMILAVARAMLNAESLDIADFLANPIIQ